MKTKSTLSTGEFARLCKTTKETLFHYDRENILRPKFVSGNGYRRYSIEQYFDFDLISILKDTGSSLKEIRAYLQDMDDRDFLSLLEAKRVVVKKERERLEQREMTLRGIAAVIREVLDFTFDTFMVLEQEEDRLEVLPTQAALSETREEHVGRWIKYLDFYKNEKRTPRYPFGIIVSQEDVARGRYLERYFFSRATRATPLSRLHVKPKGKYAVIAHKGSEETHREVFLELLRHLQAEGLNMAGDVYIYDMMSYTAQGAGGIFTAKYCILVT